ncbi:MAG: prepilin-type N-terminal cleavage/methylation domain-containing protein [Candidatus Hydrogenedentota bacterium]
MNLSARFSQARRNEKGFTLLELLVICVILGILGVLMFANLKRAIWKAREGKTYVHLNTLRTAVQAFSAMGGPGAGGGGQYKPKYNGNYMVTPNSTNGFPWNLKEGSWGPSPPVGGEGYLMEDGQDGWRIETGGGEVGDWGYGAGVNRFLAQMPSALIGKNGDPLCGDGYYNEGKGGTAGWCDNFVTTAVPNINGNWRGWYYKNTTGNVRINNNSLSTDGQEYYKY